MRERPFVLSFPKVYFARVAAAKAARAQTETPPAPKTFQGETTLFALASRLEPSVPEAPPPLRLLPPPKRSPGAVEAADAARFARLTALARSLGKIRRRVAADLRRPRVDRRKILAAVVRLLETVPTHTGENGGVRGRKAGGLVTLGGQPVAPGRAGIVVAVRGDSGRRRIVDLHDPRLVRVIRACRATPGDELLSYAGRGRSVPLRWAEVNAYLRAITRRDFTAADFHAWTGTVLAAAELEQLGPARTPAAALRHVEAIIACVATRLGQPTAVCRAAMVHPEILRAYLEGETAVPATRRVSGRASRSLTRLSAVETAVLKLLRRRLPAARRRA